MTGVILEKNKVYKVKHNRALFDVDYPRDYIIFSPKKDISFPEGFFDDGKAIIYGRDSYKRFYTNFTVCLDGEIITYKGNSSATSVDKCCVFLPLTQEDYEDIRKAVGMLDNGCLYNRKLNKLVFNVEKRASI